MPTQAVFEFSLDVEPTPKGRPRLTKTGKAYTPKPTKIAEENIRAELWTKWKGDPLEGPLTVRACYYLSRPKSVTIKKRPFPIARPDLDNYDKLLLDACNKVVWDDDSQIINMSSSKRYADDCTPKIVFTVEMVR